MTSYALLKKTFLLSTAIVFSLFNATFTMAQSEQGQFRIKGKVLDDASQEPIPFTQVALFEGETSDPEAYSTTDEEGNFTLRANRGKYTLKFFLVGYEDKEISDIEVNNHVDLDNITLTEENQQLEEVVVQSTRAMMQTNVEGITINPQQNLSNLGGTLLDILRNTPSVSVSDDGSISLRGSNGTNVLINGRNSSLTQNLDRIPASAIEQIKVINNPNARYDAEAEAGIIDIVLKKGDELGTHGGVDAVYGTRGRMSVGAQFNHRAINYNVYAGYNLRRWRDVGIRRSEREIFGDGEFLNQETDSREKDLGHNFNYGADYYFGKNTLSYEGVFNTSLNQQVNTLYSRLSELNTDDLLLEYVRRNDESETDDGTDNALIYERSFDQKGRSFKFSASQSYTNQYKTQNIDIFRNTATPDPDGLDGQERAVTDEKRFNYVFQADYIHPLPKQMQLETGLKSNLRNFEYDYDYARLDEANQTFVEDPAISNRFDYQDRIHAAYVILSKTSEKLDVTAGLRGEYTSLSTYLYNTDEENRQDYFNLFPSLQTLYKLTEKHAAKLTYSRRIDRPTAWRLNPFPDITDSLNVRRGNPSLQPEMINSLELGHIYEGVNVSVTTNFFYRHISGQLDYITTVEDGISYSQPANLNSASSYGAELIGLTELAPWWTLSGSLTGFRINVDGSNVSEEFVNSGFAFNTKATSDFKLPYNFLLQLVFNYDSPEVEAQGRDLAQYYVDANIQKRFFENKANVSLSLRDVFDTLRFAGNSLTNTFSQSFYAKRETRILLLSARYSF
ncbi:TonB-dependent receptor [Catalinimonas sp. 4WD22]|uniref:TonB-dependent receptor domain-containing protein n=1 Tax=Catalinimonas locisalis TaxID=3133978 RepID=UPI00310135BE